MRLGPVLLLALTLPASADPAIVPFSPWEGAGGWSGLWVSDDGGRFAAASDRGAWAEGRLEREGGRLVAAPVDRRDRLDPGGDAEGLARLPSGDWAISFEGPHRVESRAAPDAPPRDLGLPDLERRFNSGPEALAVDARGRAWTLPETPDADGAFPVLRRDGSTWTEAFRLPARGGYGVSGADFGPDGRLYVLERAFLLLGFRSRIRSVAPDGSDPRTHVETAFRDHGNLEGIAVWSDGDGLVATTISDDDFRPIQRSEIVEFRLP